MTLESGGPLAELFADGGMVENAFLVQFIADIARVAVRASTVPELSALGGALAGMLGMGIHGSLEDLERLDLGARQYSPRMPPAQADQLYAGWKRAVERTF
jgi:glycerol kinase